MLPPPQLSPSPPLCACEVQYGSLASHVKPPWWQNGPSQFDCAPPSPAPAWSPGTMSGTTVAGSIGELGGSVRVGLVGSPGQPLPLLNSPMQPTCQLVVLEELPSDRNDVRWLRTKSTVQHGLVSPSAHPDGAGSSGLVTCQMPDCTDSHPARVHAVSPDATMSAAAQSSARPPPLIQSTTTVLQGMNVPSAHSGHDAIAAALARVALVL